MKVRTYGEGHISIPLNKRENTRALDQKKYTHEGQQQEQRAECKEREKKKVNNVR